MRIDDSGDCNLPSPSLYRGWRRTAVAATVSAAVHLSAGLALYDWNPNLQPTLADREIRVALVNAPAPVVSQTPRTLSPPVAMPAESAGESAPNEEAASVPAAPKAIPRPAPTRQATPVRAVAPPAAPKPTQKPAVPPRQQMAKASVSPMKPTASASSRPAITEPVFAAPSLAGLSNPKPPYPLMARRRGLEGEVLLSVQVRADGRVASVEVKQSSGHPILDRAALKTLSRWRFVPARQGEQPVSASIEVPIRFQLRDAG